MALAGHHCICFDPASKYAHPGMLPTEHPLKMSSGWPLCPKSPETPSTACPKGKPRVSGVRGAPGEPRARQPHACSGMVSHHLGGPGVPGTLPALRPTPGRRNASTEEFRVPLTPFYAIAAGPGKTSSRGRRLPGEEEEEEEGCNAFHTRPQPPPPPRNPTLPGEQLRPLPAPWHPPEPGASTTALPAE